MKTYTQILEESVNEEKLTKDSVKAKLKALGISFKYDSEWNEYVVNYIGGKEASSYHTDDLQDALATGTVMAKKNESINERLTSDERRKWMERLDKLEKKAIEANRKGDHEAAKAYQEKRNALRIKMQKKMNESKKLNEQSKEVIDKARDYSSYYKVAQLNTMLKKAVEEKNKFEIDVIAEALRNLRAWKGISFVNGKYVYNNIN